MMRRLTCWYAIILFTVCRIILVAPAVSKNTFKTILSEPSISVDSLRTIVLKLRKILKTPYSRSLPAVTSIPLHTGVRWLPTFKYLPTMGEYASALIRRKRIDPHRRRAAFSSFCVEAYERYSFTVLLMMNVSNGYGSYGPLSVKTTRFAFDEVGNKVLEKLCSSLFNDYTFAFSNVSSVYEMLPVRLGMLGSSFPGSGKRRIFAIGNYVIQRMLKGPHDWCASLLKTLKTDGTYNQTQPLDYIVGHSSYWSFDLSSATDRFPLAVMEGIMIECFGPAFGAAVEAALGTNIFHVPFVKTKIKSKVSFKVGQPLGYFASWPLFALSHHF